MRITVKKIAELTNVSRGTVDRVLNNRDGVKPEIRKRVQEVAEALGYKPNIVGKALSNQGRPSLIGIILPPIDNPFYGEIQKGINNAIEEYRDFGLRIEYRIMASLTVTEQISCLKYFEEKQANGICLVAIDCPPVNSTVKRMTEKGIQFITFVSDLSDAPRMCFVGHEFERGGRVVAQLMNKIISGKRNIAVLGCFSQYQAHQLRLQGFLEKNKEMGSPLNVVEMIENDDRDEVSFEKLMQLYNSRGLVDGIYAVGAGVAGIGKFVRLVGEGRVKVITYDLVPSTVLLLNEGIIDFTIYQNPIMEGYSALKLMADYILMNKKPDQNKILTKVEIKVPENLD